MDYQQLFRHESDLFLRKGSGCSITKVAHNRMSNVSHLNAYLMVSSRFQLNFYKTFRPEGIQHTVSESCFLGLICSFGKNAAGPFRPSLDEMNESPGRFFQSSMEYCKILLLDRTGSELLAQALCRFGCATVEDHSGYRAIQTVDQG